MKPHATCRVPYDTLLDYAEERADAATAEQMRAHLAAGCPHCEQQLAQIARLLPAMREAGAVEVPQGVVERAKAIYRERFQKPARVPLIARLLSDSRAGLAPAGVRGAERTGVRLVYATDAHEIELWQEREDGGWYIIGQVVARGTGDALAPDAARLESSAGAAIEGAPEADEFHLADVPAGDYALTLRLGEQEILLPDVTVGG